MYFIHAIHTKTEILCFYSQIAVDYQLLIFGMHPLKLIIRLHVCCSKNTCICMYIYLYNIVCIYILSIINTDERLHDFNKY